MSWHNQLCVAVARSWPHSWALLLYWTEATSQNSGSDKVTLQLRDQEETKALSNRISKNIVQNMKMSKPPLRASNIKDCSPVIHCMVSLASSYQPCRSDLFTDPSETYPYPLRTSHPSQRPTSSSFLDRDTLESLHSQEMQLEVSTENVQGKWETGSPFHRHQEWCLCRSALLYLAPLFWPNNITSPKAK